MTDGAIVQLRRSGMEETAKITVPIDWAKPLRRQRLTPNTSSPSVRERQKAERNVQAHRKLVQAISRAHSWYQDIRSGEVVSIDELAARENRSVRSVRLNLVLAWLAPDIVRAAIDGKIDPNLSATELARSLPTDWAGQRRMLGLALTA